MSDSGDHHTAQQNCNAAFLNSQTAVLNATIAGMVAENRTREIQRLAPAYGEQSFDDVIANSGCGYNHAHTTLTNNL